MLPSGGVVGRPAEIVVSVLPHNCAAACRCLLAGKWRLRRGGGGINFEAIAFDGYETRKLRLEEELGTFDSQPDRCWPGKDGTLNATAIYVQSVTAIKIANPPIAAVENYLGMYAGYVVVLDRDFAFVGSADSERDGEGEGAEASRGRPDVYF
jgi:hypothetical protein